MPGTYLILGAPHSGTSLILHILGAAPTFRALGEFEYWLIERRGEFWGGKHRVTCKGCQGPCPVWDAAPDFTEDDLYRQVRRFLQAEWVVDSIRPSWLDDWDRKETESTVGIVMHKSIEDFTVSTLTKERVNSAPAEEIAKAGRLWVDLYQAHRRFVEAADAHQGIDLLDVVFVSYEQLVFSPAFTVYNCLRPALGAEGATSAASRVPKYWAASENTRHAFGGTHAITEAIVKRDSTIKLDPKLGMANAKVREVLSEVPGAAETKQWLVRHRRHGNKGV